MNILEIDLNTTTYTKNVLRDNIFNFVLSNNKLVENKRFLCINIEDVQSHNDYYGLINTDNLIRDIAKYLILMFPKSKVYRYRGEKFIVDLVDNFIGIEQKFKRNIKYSFVEVSICRKQSKHFRIIDEIFLSIDKALLNTSLIGHLEKYSFYA